MKSIIEIENERIILNDKECPDYLREALKDYLSDLENKRGVLEGYNTFLMKEPIPASQPAVLKDPVSDGKSETEYVKSQETDNSARVNTLAGYMKLIDAAK